MGPITGVPLPSLPETPKRVIHEPELPVDKTFRAEFVRADQDLYWLAMHGRLMQAARMLAGMRAEIEGDTGERGV